jgi:(heptosyl)LPS beta-1,4-glucosyltransferase
LTPEASRPTLSVVITTKDEAELLPECLDSVAWADEIVVVDMFSSDHTAEICARYPQCAFFQRSDFINANMNFGFEKARGDWIMRLDTDERVTPELAAEVQELVRTAPDGVTGYSFWERPVILGRELRHGFGRRHHRQMLFRRGAARYPLKSQHESLDTSGTWLRGQHGYLHLNYRSVRQYLEKANYYTDRELEQTGPPATAPPAWRALRQTASVFYLNYVKQQGFREGWVGFVDASMRAFYQFLLWAKRRESYEAQRAAPPG